MKHNHEIGSFFEIDSSQFSSLERNELNHRNSDVSEMHTISGRTAIDIAIQDIAVHKKIKTAYLPSYCCESMIEPFKKRNIEVQFYTVFYENEAGLQYDIDCSKDCDIFLAMSYFGIDSMKIDEYISVFSERDVVVIEDTTHRLLSIPDCSFRSNYQVASLRKWLAIPSGGMIKKRDGVLLPSLTEPDQDLIKIKLEAMTDKNYYLNNSEEADKKEFMRKFSLFEKSIRNFQASYAIDSTSYEIIQNTDLSQVRKARVQNASYLNEAIKNLEIVKPLLPNFDYEKDCPLFYPIVLNKHLRDDLRSHLINENIFCPVHWPREGGIEEGIESIELSLICDQRYDITDMKRIISVIERWEKTIMR